MPSRRWKPSPSASSCARRKKLAGLAGIEELAKARREVLPYGAFVLERLLKVLNPSEVVFSVFGIREGLIYSLLPDARATQGSAAQLLRRVRQPEVALHRARLGAVQVDGRAVRAARPQGDARGDAACAMPPASSPTSAGASTPTIAASRASTCWPTPALSGIDHPGRVFHGPAIFYRHAAPARSMPTSCPNG